MTVEKLLNIKENEPIDIESLGVSSCDILDNEMINGTRREDGKVRFSTVNAQLSHIWSHIIENAGRFSLRNSSDILITYDHMKKELEEDGVTTFGYLFAFRESGVDGFPLFRARVADDKTNYIIHYGYYRKILLISLKPIEGEDNTAMQITLSNIVL